jgi:hypothetical protein
LLLSEVRNEKQQAALWRPVRKAYLRKAHHCESYRARSDLHPIPFGLASARLRAEFPRVCGRSESPTKYNLKPAESAMDRDRLAELSLGACDFLRQMPLSCQWRFRLLAVYYIRGESPPSFERFQNAFTVPYHRHFANKRKDLMRA